MGILANRRQHREATSNWTAIVTDQAVSEQAFEQLCGLPPQAVVAIANCLRTFDSKGASEDRQAAEQRLLRCGKQVITPVECGAECVLSRGQIPTSSGQQPQPMLQP